MKLELCLVKVYPELQTPNPRFEPIEVPRGGRIYQDELVRFNANSNRLSNPGLAEETLYKIIKTLKVYPHLKVYIQGNTSTLNTEAQRHKEAGEVSPVYLNIQKSRAEAVMKFLIDRGIKPERIEAREGEHRYQGKSGMTTTFILENPN